MEEIMDVIQKALGESVTQWNESYGKRFYGNVASEGIVDAARSLVETHGLRLSTVSGVDTRDSIELLYHFSLDTQGAVITLRVTLPKKKLEVDSIAPWLKSAEWIEREITEMLGVTFAGHPDPRPLLCAEDWPEGTYPLRRDDAGLQS